MHNMGRIELGIVSGLDKITSALIAPYITGQVALVSTASMAIPSSGTPRLAVCSMAALLHYRCCNMRGALLQALWRSLHCLYDDPESPTYQVQFSHKTCNSQLDVHVPCAYNSSSINGTHTSADLGNKYNDIAAVALSCSDCEWLYCSACICKKLLWVIREEMAKYPSNAATA